MKRNANTGLNNEHGHLLGVLSIDDVLQAPRRRGATTSDDVVEALKTICSPRAVAQVTA